MVRCFKKQTGAEIHYLVKQSFAHTIHDNPYIDKIHVYKPDSSTSVSNLKAENFDLIVDLQKNMKSFKISQSLGVKTIRFNKMNVRKWLTVNLKINNLPKGKHLVDRYFDALSETGIKDDGEGLDYFIMPEDEFDAQELIKGIPEFQVLVLGATYLPNAFQKKDVSISFHYTLIPLSCWEGKMSISLLGKFQHCCRQKLSIFVGK